MTERKDKNNHSCPSMTEEMEAYWYYRMQDQPTEPAELEERPRGSWIEVGGGDGGSHWVRGHATESGWDNEAETFIEGGDGYGHFEPTGRKLVGGGDGGYHEIDTEGKRWIDSDGGGFWWPPG